MFAVGEGKVDGCIPLARIYYLAHTADAVETRCGVDDLVGPVVQLSDREQLILRGSVLCFGRLAYWRSIRMSYRR